MPWTLLRSDADWRAYRDKSMSLAAAALPGAVFVGSGPTSYPCLVDSMYVPSINRHYAAFVTVSDAAALLSQEGQQAGVSAGPSQSAFNRWVASQMLATAWFLVETGICTREQYQDKLTEALDAVDAGADAQAAFFDKLQQLGRE